MSTSSRARSRKERTDSAFPRLGRKALYCRQRLPGQAASGSGSRRDPRVACGRDLSINPRAGPGRITSQDGLACRTRGRVSRPFQSRQGRGASYSSFQPGSSRVPSCRGSQRQRPAFQTGPPSTGEASPTRKAAGARRSGRLGVSSRLQRRRITLRHKQCLPPATGDAGIFCLFYARGDDPRGWSRRNGRGGTPRAGHTSAKSSRSCQRNQ